MRTQYMRTAFQIPFDATVRVSLDTNLCMISERGYDLESGKRWHRDPKVPIKNTEIARFPHAVLEIKLEVKEGASTPQWVTDLQNSGMLYEVHKFSKFIHGCATLQSEDVRAVPYWIDDKSVKDSIIASGSGHILAGASSTEFGERASAGPGANQIYPHLLPHGTVAENKKDVQGRASSMKVDRVDQAFGQKYQNYGLTYQEAYGDEEDDDEGCENCSLWPGASCRGFAEEEAAPTSIQKIEPKVFFANERTFLHWLHMGVLLSGVASGVLAFSPNDAIIQFYGVLLLPVALGFCLYALHTFLWRAERIKMRVPGRWDDPLGPVVIAVTLTAVLTLNFFMRLFDVVYSEL
jgi:uncharacterized membrane protein YidH (DUF202 family)